MNAQRRLEFVFFLPCLKRAIWSGEGGLWGVKWAKSVCAAEKNTLICAEDEREMLKCKYIQSILWSWHERNVTEKGSFWIRRGGISKCHFLPLKHKSTISTGGIQTMQCIKKKRGKTWFLFGKRNPLPVRRRLPLLPHGAVLFLEINCACTILSFSLCCLFPSNSITSQLCVSPGIPQLPWPTDRLRSLWGTWHNINSTVKQRCQSLWAASPLIEEPWKYESLFIPSHFKGCGEKRACLTRA